MSSADILFTKATHDIKRVKSINNELLLSLYANFKQVTIGNCNINPPSMLNFKDTAKYNSWKNLFGISKLKAQVNYIKLVKSITEKNEI